MRDCQPPRQFGVVYFDEIFAYATVGFASLTSGEAVTVSTATAPPWAGLSGSTTWPSGPHAGCPLGHGHLRQGRAATPSAPTRRRAPGVPSLPASFPRA